MALSTSEQFASTTDATQNSISFHFGKYLGRAFVSAKNKASTKYKEITSGINQSIEDEETRRFQELQMMLDDQACEYENHIINLRKGWIKKSILAAFIMLLLGGAIATTALYYIMHMM